MPISKLKPQGISEVQLFRDSGRNVALRHIEAQSRNDGHQDHHRQATALARIRAAPRECETARVHEAFMQAWRRTERKMISRNQRDKILGFGLFLTSLGVSGGATVVVNEIHFHPADKHPVEFVELYNSASQAIALTGWSLNKFVFPSNTVIKPGGFLVLAAKPTAFEKEFGFKAFGPLETKLKHTVGTVRLENAQGKVVDEVHYGTGFPWPTAADGGGSSLERLNPEIPGNSPGSWRSSGFPLDTVKQAVILPPEQRKSAEVPKWQHPTPGARNSVFTERTPPLVSSVTHSPQQPKSGQPVSVSVRVTNPQAASNLTLHVQVVEPGKYIRYVDKAYRAAWTEFPMQRLGSNAFSAIVPGELQKHRGLVRYRVTVTGTSGSVVQIPYSDDEISNFAWFVYDGLPIWTGASNPGRTPALTFSPAMLNTLPVYHLIAREEDVSRSQWDEGHNREPFFGTLVYNGKVYDHIQFHNRGQASTYLAGKNKWAFKFNRGQYLAARDDYGRPYEHLWHSLDMNACASPWVQMNRGMAGMDEALAFRSFQLAGVMAANTYWLHFRVIQNAEENTATSQYRSDLWGLYLAIQPMDGQWLEELRLPGGNVYSLQSGRKYLAQGMPADNSDWNQFSRAISGNPSEVWWRNHLDMPAFFSFHALNRLLANVDLREEANHAFYHAPDGHWAPIPWDNDMMFIPHSHQSGVIYPVRCLEFPSIRLEFKNRAREILDLFVSDRSTNGGQFGQLVDEYARLLRPAGQNRTWPELDMAMWNYHPRSNTRGEFYVNPYTRGWSGLPFRRLLDTPDFEGFCHYIVNFCTDSRRKKDYQPDDNNPVGYGWGYLSCEANDDLIPARPTVNYTGTQGFPITNLTFHISAFASPALRGQPQMGFAAVQWRVAQIRAPGLAGYEPGKAYAYELTPSWESEELSQANPQFQFPSDACLPGRTYRVRARYKDASGKWSHWAQPVQFETHP